MSAELEQELRRLHRGQHLCLFYDDVADTWETLVPYFKSGLARRERCLFVGRDDDVREAARALGAAGVDVGREVSRGALVLLTSRDCYFARPFGPEAMVEALDAMVTAALRDGFTGLRCSGEMPHEQAGALFDERDLVEYEARLSDYSPGHAIVGICRYDLRRSPPSLVHEALRLHPLAVVGPLVCPNVYYEPPAMALGRCAEQDRVHWMLEQLSQARREKLALEQALVMRDEFLSAASHELRTPLTSAQLHVQGVLRRAQSADGALPASWVVPKLQRAQEQFEKLVELIQRLLDASQMSAGRVQFQLEEVDLADVVRRALARLDDVLKRARCTVQLVTPPGAIVGRWDRMRLDQVVTNLVTNAAKYGGGALIEVTLAREDGAARLVVRDHGIGMRAEDLPRIFERFERAAPGEHYGGFGLGLWIVKRIVAGLGGTITAASAGPGAGSTFTVVLPLAGAAGTSPGEPSGTMRGS